MPDQVFFDDLINMANQYIHSITRNQFWMLSEKMENDFKLHFETSKATS